MNFFLKFLRIFYTLIFARLLWTDRFYTLIFARLLRTDRFYTLIFARLLWTDRFYTLIYARLPWTVRPAPGCYWAPVRTTARRGVRCGNYWGPPRSAGSGRRPETSACSLLLPPETSATENIHNVWLKRRKTKSLTVNKI